MRTNESNLTRFAQNVKTYVSQATQTPDIVAIFEVAAGNAVGLKNLVGNDIRIDWGDKMVDHAVEADITHTYNDGGKYICKIYNVTSIGEEALYQNKNLISLTIGNSVKEIGAFAFEKCSKLTEIVLSEGLTTIGNRAIRETAITKIVLPSTVTSVGNYAFYGCTQLKSFIMIDGSNVTFGKQTFGSDSSLVEVKLSNSLTKLPNQMFQNCTSLKSVIIPKSVVTIENGYTFLNCTNLTAYCERASLPNSGWDSTWDMLTKTGPKCPVVWGYKHKNYPEIVTELSNSLKNSNLDQDFFNSLYN